jgi:hypothetical protein
MLILFSNLLIKFFQYVDGAFADNGSRAEDKRDTRFQLKIVILLGDHAAGYDHDVVAAKLF